MSKYSVGPYGRKYLEAYRGRINGEVSLAILCGMRQTFASSSSTLASRRASRSLPLAKSSFICVIAAWLTVAAASPRCPSDISRPTRSRAFAKSASISAFAVAAASFARCPSAVSLRRGGRGSVGLGGYNSVCSGGGGAPFVHDICMTGGQEAPQVSWLNRAGFVPGRRLRRAKAVD